MQDTASTSTKPTIDKFSQDKLLGRSYQAALERAFGISHSYTTHIDVDKEENEKLVKECKDGSTLTLKISQRRKNVEQPSLSAALALIEHDDTGKLVNVPLAGSRTSPTKYKGQTILFAAVLYGDNKTVLDLLMKGVSNDVILDRSYLHMHNGVQHLTL